MPQNKSALVPVFSFRHYVPEFMSGDLLDVAFSSLAMPPGFSQHNSYWEVTVIKNPEWFNVKVSVT